MDVWGWIVLYVLLFALLQFLLYRYLREEDSSPLQSAPASFDPTGLDDHVADGGEEPGLEGAAGLDEDRRQCSHCGTVNDTDYTYCRNCVNPMVG